MPRTPATDGSNSGRRMTCPVGRAEPENFERRGRVGHNERDGEEGATGQRSSGRSIGSEAQRSLWLGLSSPDLQLHLVKLYDSEEGELGQD